MPGPPTLREPFAARVEHGVLALAFVGVAVYVVATGATSAWRVAFWAVAPDLVFVPIGIAVARLGGAWPPWGPALYNVAHSYATLVAVVVAASLLQGHVVLPLIGWAVHLEVDRALGFTWRGATPTT